MVEQTSSFSIINIRNLVTPKNSDLFLENTTDDTKRGERIEIKKD